MRALFTVGLRLRLDKKTLGDINLEAINIGAWSLVSKNFQIRSHRFDSCILPTLFVCPVVDMLFRFVCCFCVPLIRSKDTQVIVPLFPLLIVLLESNHISDLYLS